MCGLGVFVFSLAYILSSPPSLSNALFHASLNGLCLGDPLLLSVTTSVLFVQ